MECRNAPPFPLALLLHASLSLLLLLLASFFFQSKSLSFLVLLPLPLEFRKHLVVLQLLLEVGNDFVDFSDGLFVAGDGSVDVRFHLSVLKESCS
ncbi:hypothetical protein WR25_15278 [Diploscapter pachys]|uniref:Uncharacterized protein n=1 Tax=Diploscapter pachys TaxID=2018661 RepID=A0A2A2KFR6_9BILA|nr:hypothetical protein WR25_15278 [Diploscapter pachys]